MKKYKNLRIYEHTINVDCGDGAHMTIANLPNTTTNLEWQLRHASNDIIVKNRMLSASLLASYDYLLSSNINQAESIRRLKILRKARKQSLNTTKRMI